MLIKKLESKASSIYPLVVVSEQRSGSKVSYIHAKALPWKNKGIYKNGRKASQMANIPIKPKKKKINKKINKKKFVTSLNSRN